MQTIVLDLEFCKIGRKNKEKRAISRNEIIQIGAVRLDERDEIVDRFDCLVKPLYGHVDHCVESLTHLTDALLSEGAPYEEAVGRFLDWVGVEETKIGSWSMEDKTQFVRENRLKNFSDIRLDSLLANWFDIQELFDKKLKVDQQISLHNALRGAGITFIGQEHSAVDDAQNTAYLYRMMRDEKKFRKKMEPLIELLTPTESLSYSLNSLIRKAMKDENKNEEQP